MLWKQSERGMSEKQKTKSETVILTVRKCYSNSQKSEKTEVTDCKGQKLYIKVESEMSERNTSPVDWHSSGQHTKIQDRKKDQHAKSSED